MSPLRSLVAAVAATALLGAPPAASAQAPPAALLPATSSPLSAVEHWRLRNGVRVWYLRMPGRAAVSITVAGGSDVDPPDRPGVAHLLEHAQFGDRDGRTEAQLNAEMDAIGADVGARTFADQTSYFATAPAAHGADVVRWLGRVVSPLAITPALVDRQRGPLAIELRTRAGAARLLDRWTGPAALRPPGDWERAFDLASPERAGDAAAGMLDRLTSEDLVRHYRAHYVPSRMTLVVVGDVPRDSVEAAANATLGALPAAAAPPPREVVALPRAQRETTWKTHDYTLYRLVFALDGLSVADRGLLAVTRELLQKRLDDRLRFSARAVAYHPSVTYVARGPVALLTISVQTTDRDVDAVRDGVAAELARFRDGTIPPADLSIDGRVVAARLAPGFTSAEGIEGALSTLFAAAGPSDAGPPDPVRIAAELTPARLAAFTRAHLRPERTLERIDHALPSPRVLALLGLVMLLVVAGVVARGRRRLTRSVDMRRIRYVARLRVSRVYGSALVALAVACVLVAARLATLGLQWLAYGALWRVDSLVVQAAACAIVLALVTALVLLALSRVPRKLLVFDDGAAVKYASYRSVPIARGEAAELTMLRFRDVWLGARARRAALLAAGLRRPAIYLRRRGGPAFYFRTRDTAEALAVLREHLEPLG